MNKTILRSLLLALAGVFALGLRAQAEDPMFYIGGTGYASWADAYNAAQNGATITVGANATMAISGGKTVTIDLAGGALNWEAAGYTWGIITVVDSVGSGELTLSGSNRNVNGATVDLSSLAGAQLTGGGKFYTSAGTMVQFPEDMKLADCTAKIALRSAAEVGARIVVKGVTYTWDGSSWVSDAPSHDITITAPQNGTLETSVTNDVAAGTIVTVTATPAAGYLFASVTTNGAALAGMTFEMPSEDVTVAATFDDQESPTRMFYIGGTGYDNWAAAYAAAQNGATITVGANAEISGTVGGKTFILDLCGRTVNIISGWWNGTVAVIDSAAPAGRFVVVPANGGNFSQSKVDFSALASTQVSGKFQLTDASSIMTFPGDRSFEDCTSAVTGKSAGTRIVVQGVTYTWSGSSWQASNPVIGSFHITPLKTKATVSGSITDAGTDATACDVYFALDGGAAAKIAEGATGSFEYQITGLTAGTTYAYVLSVSNNAPTAKGTVRGGSFTTLSPSDPTTEWATGVYMPNDWRALSDNVLANVKGTMDTSHQPNNYGTNDLLVLTDGTVPSQAGKDWIVGIQPTAEITWQLAEPVMLERLRISSCYLADPHFSGVNISSVRVKCKGSDEWVEVPGSSSGKIAGDGTTGNIVCATLSDAETGYIAQQVTTLKVVFGAAVYANANYYAEIEAVGHAEAEKNVLVIAIQ